MLSNAHDLTRAPCPALSRGQPQTPQQRELQSLESTEVSSEDHQTRLPVAVTASRDHHISLGVNGPPLESLPRPRQDKHAKHHEQAIQHVASINDNGDHLVAIPQHGV